MRRSIRSWTEQARTRHPLRPHLVLLIVAVVALTMAPTAGAANGELSVDVTKGSIRFRADLDSAGMSGSFAFTGGTEATCGATVEFSLGEATWKANGAGFNARKERCVWRQPTGRLRSVVLNFARGTWRVSLLAEMEELLNPVRAGLRIGDASGIQEIQMRPVRNGWAYP